MTEQLSVAKRRVIDHLKRVDAAGVGELADALDITGAAVRQHLDQLADLGLVVPLDPEPSGGRGRPAARWALTSEADRLYPDRHADLTVELIDTIRTELGADALDRVIAARSARQRETYREALVDLPVRRRAERLAELRTAEGYLAEVTLDGDDLVLVEHHCPICDAAATCQNLCRDELEIFRSMFDGDATVERTQHLVAGDQRCSYRIRPTP